MIICQTLRLVSLLKNDQRLRSGEFGEFRGTVVAAKFDHPSPMLTTWSSACSCATVRRRMAGQGCACDAGDVALGVDRGRDGLQIEVGGSRNWGSSASSSPARVDALRLGDLHLVVGRHGLACDSAVHP